MCMAKIHRQTPRGQTMHHTLELTTFSAPSDGVAMLFFGDAKLHLSTSASRPRILFGILCTRSHCHFTDFFRAAFFRLDVGKEGVLSTSSENEAIIPECSVSVRWACMRLAPQHLDFDLVRCSTHLPAPSITLGVIRGLWPRSIQHKTDI